MARLGWVWFGAAVHTKFLLTRESGEEQGAAGTSGQDRRGQEMQHQSIGTGVDDSQRSAVHGADSGLTNWTSNVGAVAVQLSPDEMQALEDAIPVNEVAGSRYGNVTREE